MNQNGYNGYYRQGGYYNRPAQGGYYGNGGYNGGYNNGGYNNNNNNNNNNDSSMTLLKVLLPTVAAIAVIFVLLFASGAIGGNSTPAPAAAPEVSTTTTTTTQEPKTEVQQVIQYIAPEQKKEYVYVPGNNYNYNNYNYNYNGGSKPSNKPSCGYTTGRYKVNTDLLYVRTGPSKSYPTVPFSCMTPNAQSQIRNRMGGGTADGLVRGCLADVSQVSGNWGKVPSGWICLDYCVKV